ncbi:MAG: single-stranded DNA-binding protein [Deltaproteobacteria bacterium]|nr:single-stranded DNA-binding protein [Deltaproteobacteria bacterium]
MSSVNKVILIGRLGQDPDVRYTASHQPVAHLSIATSENYTNKNGERVETTDWHRVVAWGKLAEQAGEYLSKGRLVYVEGRLQTRSWVGKDNQKRYSTEVVAAVIRFLDSGKGERASASQPPRPAVDEQRGGAPEEEAAVDHAEPQSAPPDDEDVPF